MSKIRIMTLYVISHLESQNWTLYFTIMYLNATIKILANHYDLNCDISVSQMTKNLNHRTDNHCQIKNN